MHTVLSLQLLPQLVLIAMMIVLIMFDTSGDIIVSGPGTSVRATDIHAADNSILSDSSLFGFCSLSRTLSAQCRNAVSNPNKAVVTVDSVTAEVMIRCDINRCQLTVLVIASDSTCYMSSTVGIISV